MPRDDDASSDHRTTGLRRGDPPLGVSRGPFGQTRHVIETADGKRVNLLPDFEDVLGIVDPASTDLASRPSKPHPDPERAFASLLDGVTPDVQKAPWKASFDDYFAARAALAEVPTALAGMWLHPLADGTYKLVDKIPKEIRRPFDRALGILLDTVVSLPSYALGLLPMGSGDRPRSKDLGLKSYPQTPGGCGETMVASWLKSRGVPVALGELDTQTPFFGGFNLLEDAALRDAGYSLVSGPGTLEDVKTYLAHGYPVMATIGWPGGGGHYVVISGYDDDAGTLRVDNYYADGDAQDVSYEAFSSHWKRHANVMWVAMPQRDGRLDVLRAKGKLSREAEVQEGLSISDIWVNERLEFFVEVAYRYKGTKDDLTLRLNVVQAQGHHTFGDAVGGSLTYTHHFSEDVSVTVHAEKLAGAGPIDDASARSVLENVALYAGVRTKELRVRAGWERGAFQASLELELNHRLASLNAGARVNVDLDGNVSVFLGLQGSF